MLLRLDPQASAQLLKRMADFSLLLDESGEVLEIEVNSEDLADAVSDDWVGSNLLSSVASESTDRANELLQVAKSKPGTPVRRDITHALPDGAELLVQYQAICPVGHSEILALGQDMRPAANLRQQLMNAQQALEQEYWRLRQIETRYRRLFEMVSDAIVVVEGESGRVTEANPEASRLLSPEGRSVIGKPFPTGFDKAGSRAVSTLMEDARSVGKGSIQGVKAADGGQTYSVTASYLRQDEEARFLVRVSSEKAGDEEPRGGYGNQHFMQETLRRAPDAVLITDDDGRVLAANKAFLDLAQLISEDQARGQSADRWLGESGVDLSVLLTNLRRNSSIKLFSTRLRGELGSNSEVEISASNTAEPGGKTFAFFIRDVGRRVDSPQQSEVKLPRSIEQISKRVGRVPLKELVRESTDIIEALCIEAALQLTHDNRASAAELLGLSRQSLYAKLRRYGIGGGSVESE